MAISVESITNVSGTYLVVSDGLSSERPLAPAESREMIIGIPSRPDSFIAGLVTDGLITRAPSSGPLKDALDNDKIIVEGDNVTYSPENISDLVSVEGYRGPDRKAFFDDVTATVKIADATVDTKEEVTDAGIDLDATPGTVETPDSTEDTIDIAISGQADDFATIGASHTSLVLPDVGKTLTSGDMVISRTKKRFNMTLTDGSSAKVAKYHSIDPINEAWEHTSSTGTSGDALVIASTAS